MALGVSDHIWTIGELIDAALSAPKRQIEAVGNRLHR
jgi:hypothetical protein